ncbi:MAG: type II toxin-antitoxin system Phd/YefM family antitoxin [Acidobacteria bacterium]|nr:type II toxin-antitoxin system Phd/YefM family antitoxin [Acidobacteriota bacterium]MBV9144516.1 type II toxin-antitoxin system Phd/YefM family antitoxin [Acidobacteriota bacterium]
MVVNIHQAKTHLSRLLLRVAGGEEITIANAGVPVARLVPLAPSPRKRRLGMDEGKLWISPDFDKPSPELQDLFEGRVRARKRRRK